MSHSDDAPSQDKTLLGDVVDQLQRRDAPEGSDELDAVLDEALLRADQGQSDPDAWAQSYVDHLVGPQDSEKTDESQNESDG